MMPVSQQHIPEGAENSIEKVVYVHRSEFPGMRAHQAAIAKMIDALSRSLEVTLLLRKYERDFTENIKDYFGLRKDLNIKSIPSLTFLPFRLDFVYGISLERELFQLSKKISSKQSVVYYRYTASTGKRMAFHACRHKAPFFCEVHNPIKSAKEVDCLKEMKGIIVITKWLQQHLTDAGLPSEKILVAPSGVDTRPYKKKGEISKEQIRKELSIPSTESLVVYTGKPYEGRGAETLIESAKFLRDSTLVLIVGCLPKDMKRLNRLVENHGLQNRVKIEGHKPLSQIPMYQLIADVLAMPYSQQWDLRQNASPIKMFEYMASGNPIVSSDIPIIREILSEQNSVLVPPDNPYLFAKGITKCLENKMFASSISKNALKQVDEYSWDARAANVEDFMNSLL